MIFVEDDSEEMNVILKETGYEDKMRTKQKDFVKHCLVLYIVIEILVSLSH